MSCISHWPPIIYTFSYDSCNNDALIDASVASETVIIIRLHNIDSSDANQVADERKGSITSIKDSFNRFFLYAGYSNCLLHQRCWLLIFILRSWSMATGAWVLVISSIDASFPDCIMDIHSITKVNLITWYWNGKVKLMWFNRFFNWTVYKIDNQILSTFFLFSTTFADPKRLDHFYHHHLYPEQSNFST